MPTKFLIIAVSLNAVLGQLCLKRGLLYLQRPTTLAGLPHFILEIAQTPWIYAAVAIQGFGYFLWMIVVTRVKLGVATASAGAVFYLLMALSAWVLFGETLSSIQWAGILLITLGVAFVSLGPV